MFPLGVSNTLIIVYGRNKKNSGEPSLFPLTNVPMEIGLDVLARVQYL